MYIEEIGKEEIRNGGTFRIWVIDRSSWRGDLLIFADGEDDLSQKLFYELSKFCVVHADEFAALLGAQLTVRDIAFLVIGYRDQEGEFHCSLCERHRDISVSDHQRVIVQVHRQ